ncbi:MAG: FHA domain-containing protein [Fibromonadaceae bacterium]|jgi:pSer/pThr/pTyr-binding forkhead associated (FHA) protein|nr:FHA domain-containing protein [Fibromonadaceae bacterium]
MPQIAVLYPEEERCIVNIPIKGLLIGRASFCDLQLKDEFVSERHCKVFFENGDLFIEDLGSTNGTFINGAEVQKSILELEQNIQIGVSVLKVQ